MEMEKISQEELNIILYKHKKWLNNEEDGKKGDLNNKDCSGLDFRYDDLWCICLESPNFPKNIILKER